MRLFIIGASGKLGQTLFKLVAQRPDLEAYGTVRRRDVHVLEFLQVAETRIFECDVEAAIDSLLFCSQDFVINCAGIIKQQGSAQLALSYVRANALAPFILADLGARLVQLSTNCVFSRRVGDRSLIGTRLSEFGIAVPSLRQMLIELHDLK